MICSQNEIRTEDKLLLRKLCSIQSHYLVSGSSLYFMWVQVILLKRRTGKGHFQAVQRLVSGPERARSFITLRKTTHVPPNRLHRCLRPCAHPPLHPCAHSFSLPWSQVTPEVIRELDSSQSRGHASAAMTGVSGPGSFAPGAAFNMGQATGMRQW